MSSGSQNGTAFSGLQGMRIRDASDFTTQAKLRAMFVTNAPLASRYVGSNAYRSKGVVNSYNFLMEIQKGLRECGVSNVAVAGQPFALTTGTVANLAGTSVIVPVTIPTRP